MSPLSPALTSLESLRDSLQDNNLKLFEIFSLRQELVAAIQKHKTEMRGEWKHYDPTRENLLFAKMRSELSRLSLRELAAFSLLMEAHAGAPANYPAWSEGRHLLELPLQEHQRINPLIVKFCLPEHFRALALAPAFAFLRDI